jgi:nucleotide-binding universal stress UspA family protein
MTDKKLKFLVAVGFSESPEDVLDKAVEVAEKYKAHVYILHVITEMPKLTFYYDAYRLWENFRDSAVVEAMDLLKKHIAKMKEQYNNIEPVVEVGDPGTTILEKAEELDVDLIIMGHHVRKGLNHVMHQNSCERVVRYSKRPVLTFYIEKDEE